MNAKPKTCVAVVVLARASSTRLPGKMLMPFGSGTVLSSTLERCQAITRATHVVLATSLNPADEALALEAENHNVRAIRGSENDVVARMLQAIEGLEPRPDIVVRACADNPLCMPSVIDAAIDELIESGCDMLTPFEYATLPFGFGQVVMTRDCLERIDREATDAAYREHVENYCLEHPDSFHVRYQVAPDALVWPDLCLTLDYLVDLVRLRSLAESLEGVAISEQPEAAMRYLRSAKVWIEGQSAGAPEGHDLVLTTDPNLQVSAARGVVLVDHFQCGASTHLGLRYADPRPADFPAEPVFLDKAANSSESKAAFLKRIAPAALQQLLAAPARPIDLVEFAAPPAEKRVHAERRRGFRSPAEESFPSQVVLEQADGLLEALLSELENHAHTELLLPNANPAQLSQAIECLGAARVHHTSTEPDPFRVLTLSIDGQLQVRGVSQPGTASSIAAFWRSGSVRAARAKVLNEEAQL